MAEKRKPLEAFFYGRSSFYFSPVVRRKFFLLLSNPIIFHLFSFSKKRKLPDAGGFFFAFIHLLLYNYTIRQVIVLTPLENPHRGGDFRLIYFQKPFFICYREIYFYSFIYLMLFAFDQKVSTILLKLSRIKRWNCIGFRHSSLSRFDVENKTKKTRKMWPL